MRIATFNVLADAYIGWGDYSHADPKLLTAGARLSHIVRQVNDLNADVIGLQEADRNLVEAFESDPRWQSLWLPKGRGKSDGCLTLVASGVDIVDYIPGRYEDGSGHVFQVTQIGKRAIANTHIRWAPAEDPEHVGVLQARQLLRVLDNYQVAAILADCNDRAGGPVRTLVGKAGFAELSSDKPTAFFNQELAELDLLAIRGIKGRLRPNDYDLTTIPNRSCASDHIPLVADLED